tara:strand:+ start:118 stop:645 length:528 start_codon:yes stop_codon:yes gene_type:complete
MQCPYCDHDDSKVIDSRDINDAVRRRRQCLGCGERFSTFERVVASGPFVVKKDGRREEFLREKFAAGIGKACEKRPLPAGTLDKMVDDIETEIFGLGKAEVPSNIIGDMIIDRLKRLDHIAYIRFASVFHSFSDITSLKKAVDTLLGDDVPLMPSAQLPLIPPVAVGRKARTGAN